MICTIETKDRYIEPICVCVCVCACVRACVRACNVISISTVVSARVLLIVGFIECLYGVLKWRSFVYNGRA
jgi:hypothetical protein